MGETDSGIRRIVDGTSWDEFCDALKDAGSVILCKGAPDDPLTRAEGWRYLTRLTRAAFESFVEASDPQAPVLRRTAHETIKIGMDNPDNIYMSAPIRGTFQYRLTGTRGTVQYLGFGTQKGNYGATGTLETTGYLHARDLELDSDGRFEIIVSTEEQAGNWLPMTPESSTLIVRQTRYDHANEIPAEIEIERTDGPGQPRHLEPARIDQALRKSAGFVKGCASIFETWAEDFSEHTNQLPMFDRERARVAGGDPNITYYHSYWRLAPDEALVIEATPPPCDYWSFQLANHWLESLDYRYFPVHLNAFMAKLRDDGSVRVVVSRENPGVDNWLDTCGHELGTMCWRWVGASEFPQPQTRVVPLAELRGD